MDEIAARLFQQNGYRFAPLVVEQWGLVCDLHIKILRYDDRSGVVQSGDIDNLIKTLIDVFHNGVVLAQCMLQFADLRLDPIHLLLQMR